MPTQELDYGSNTTYNRPMLNTATGKIVPASELDSNTDYNSLEFDSNVAFLGDAGSSRYDKNLSRQNVAYKDEFRYQNQDGWDRLGNALMQGVVGSLIGGTIEGIGYLGDSVDSVKKNEETQEKWGNWLTDVGRDLQTWTEDKYKVYTDPTTQGQFRPDKWSWWTSNAPSVFSSLSLLVPAAGVAKGTAMLGELIGLTAKLGKAAPVLTAIEQAIVSRHLESMMEAQQTYTETFNDVYGTSKDLTKAQTAASKAAASDYGANWVMLAQDIPQYMLLGKVFPKSVEANTVRLSKMLKQPVDALLAKQSYNIGWDLLGEAGEEGYQYIAQQESRRLAKVLLEPDKYDEADKMPRIGQYLKDGEFWTSAWFGAIGAGVMHATSSLVGGKERAKEETRKQNLLFSSAQISQANKAYQYAQRINDEAGQEMAFLNLASVVGASAAINGNTKNAQDLVDNLANAKYTPEELAQFGNAEGDVNYIKQNLDRVKEGIAAIGKKYDYYADPKKGNMNPTLAANLAAAEWLHEQFSNHVNKANSDIKVKRNAVPRFNGMSLEAQDINDLTEDIEATNRIIKTLKKELTNKSLTPEEREDIQERLKHREETTLPGLRKLLDERRQEHAKLPEDVKANDKEIIRSLITVNPNNKKDRTLHPDLESYNKARNSKLFGEEEIHEQSRYIDFLKRKDYELKNASKTKAPVTPQPATEEEEGVLDFAGTSQEPAEQLQGVSPVVAENNEEEGVLGSAGTPIEAEDEELIVPGSSIEDKRTEIEKRRESGKQYYHLEGKPGDYYYYYNTLDGGVEEVHGATEKEVNDKINAKYDAELAALESLPTPIKDTKNKADAKKEELTSATEESVEAIRTNPSHSNPEANKVYPLDVRDALVSFKGHLGTLSVGVFESLDGTFTEQLDNNRTLAEQGASIVPRTILNISFGGNTVKIEGKDYYIPATISEALRKEGQITLQDKQGKAVTFTNPLVVQELGVVLGALEEARVEVFKTFQVDQYNPAIVNAPDGKKYHLYYSGKGWYITNTNGKKALTGPRIQGLLNKVFEALDEAILDNINKNRYNETIDTGRFITILERPSEAEANNSADVATIQTPEQDKERQGVPTPDSKQEGKKAEGEHFGDAANRLAQNEEANEDALAENIESIPESSLESEEDFEDIGTDGSVEHYALDFVPETTGEVNAKNNLTLVYQFKDNELINYLLNPDNTLGQATVEFSIDFDGEFASKYWETSKTFATLLNNKDREKIFRINPKNDDNLIDTVPIKATIKTADGKVFNSHLLTVKNLSSYTGAKPLVKIPANILAIKDKEAREAATQELYNQYRAELRDTRARIIQAYLDGKVLTGTNLGKEAGEWINTHWDKATSTRVPNEPHSIRSEVGKSASNIELAFSYVEGTMQNEGGGIVSAFVPPYLQGSIFFYTGIRPNGAPGWARAKYARVSEEHADIIFNAFFTGLNSKGGFATNVTTPRLQVDSRVWYGEPGSGMSSRNVLDYLIVWKEGQPYVKNANPNKDKVFIGTKGKVLYYGTNSIDFSKVKPGTPEFEQARKEFIEYLKNNKSYRVNARTLEHIHPYSSQIGSLKLTKGLTNKEIVINNNIILTDISKHSVTGSLWNTPMIHFDGNTLQEKESTVTNKPSTSPEIKPTIRRRGGDKFGPVVKSRLAPKRKTKTPNLKYSTEQLQKEVREINEMLPRTGVRITDQMIEVATRRGRYAFGQIRNNMITLYTAGEVGTGYHEAFHAVSLYYLTDEQRTEVYNEAKRVYPSLKNATDDKIEEYLAERFRDYKLQNKQTPMKSSKIRQFFSDLLDFIYTFFTGKHRLGDVDIERLFKAIDRGKFKRVRPSIKSDDVHYSRKIGSFSRKESYNIAKNFVFYALNLNNIVTADDVSKLSFKPVAEFFANEYKAILADKDNPAYDHDVLVYREILENFDAFVDLANDFMTSLNISARPVQQEDGTFLKDEYDIGFDEIGTKAEWDVAAYEHDAADSILANVKLFLATTPVGTASDITGLPEFMDFHQMWARLMYDVCEESTFEEIIEVLKSKVDENPIYNVLLYGIQDNDTGKIVRPGLADKATSHILKAQVANALLKFRYNHITIRQVGGSGSRSYKMDQTSAKHAALEQVRMWGDRLQESPYLVDPGKRKINAAKANAVAARIRVYKERAQLEYTNNGRTLPNAVEYLNKMVDMLKVFNADITTEALLHLALQQGNTKDEGIYQLLVGNNGIEGLAKFLEDYRNSEDRAEYTKAFRKIAFINRAAEAYAATSSDRLSNVNYGPDNNPVYTYGQNSFLTDKVKRLKKDKYTRKKEGKAYDKAAGELKILKNVTVNKNSWILPQLEEKSSNFGISTLIGFNNKSFKNLEETDDFLNRYVAIRNGYIPLPTLAGKSTYHFYEGIRKLDVVNGIIFTNDPQTGQIVDINFSPEILKVFKGYAENERLRVEETKKYIDSIEAIDPDKRDYSNSKFTLIKYYHYQEIDSNGHPILKVGNTYTGNGTKYINFPGLEGQQITDKLITSILRARIIDTINYANKLGIVKIKKNSENKIERINNNFLDKADLDNVYETVYKKKTRNSGKNMLMATYSVLADYTLNGIMSTLETDMMFSGDVAFYKDAKDKLKRMNAFIASGDAILSSIPDKEEFSKTNYSVATIKTRHTDGSYLLNKYLEAFADSLQRNHKDDKYTREQALNEARSLLSVYGKNDPSDGQVFITPQMHRQILNRLGEWSDEKETAYNHLMSDEDLTLEQEHEMYKLVMQPLKLVYYGLHNLIGSTINVPVYDKMSMMTLFPRQVSETPLEPLYKRMTDPDNPVDCIKFDTAVKVGDRVPFEYFNEDGSAFVESLSNMVVTKQHFENLKRQVRTDAKDSNNTRLATQVKKLFYHRTEETGKLYGALSKKGVARLMRKISEDGKTISYKKLYKILNESGRLSNMSERTLEALTTDDQGNPRLLIDAFPSRSWIVSRLLSIVGKNVIDTTVKGNQYIQATSIGTSEDLKLSDAKGRTEVITSINLFSHLIPDYNNKTFAEARQWILDNRDQLEGIAYRVPSQGQNMVVQMVIKDVLPSYTGNTILVPYEFTTLTDSDFDVDKLFMFLNNYKIVNNKAVKINYVEADNEEGTIIDRKKLEELYNQRYGEYEARLKQLEDIKREALDRFRTNELGKKIKDRDASLEDFINAKLEAISEQLEARNIVDIKPKELDDVIAELRRKPTLEQFIRSHSGRNANDLNSEEAIQNKILQIYKEELTRDDNSIETKISLGIFAKKLKKLSYEIQEKTKQSREFKPLEAASIVNQLDSKHVFATAKSGVAPFVLSITHGMLTLGTKTLRFKGLPNGTKHIGIGNVDENGYTDFTQPLGVDGEYIMNWLSGGVTANVDAEKDPYIFYLNVNKETWGVITMLIRAGAGLDAFYFLSQPGLREMAETVVRPGKYNNKIRQSIEEYTDRLVNSIVKRDKISKSKAKDMAAVLIGNYSNDQDIFNVEKLSEQYEISITKPNDVNYLAYQIAIMNKYNVLRKVGWGLTSSVLSSQVDTKGYGNSVSSLRLFNNRVNKAYANEYFEGTEELHKKTFLAEYKKNSIDLLLELLQTRELDATLTVARLFDELVREANLDFLPSAEKESIVRNINGAIYGSLVEQYFSGSYGHGVTKADVKGLFRGPAALGKQLSLIKLDKKDKDNALLSVLRYYNDRNDNWFIEIPSVDTRNKDFVDSIKDGWEELLTSSDPSLRSFAQRLISYAFYESGTMSSKYSLWKYIPETVPLQTWSTAEGAITFNEFIRRKLNEYNDPNMMDANVSRLKKAIYENNWSSPNIVPKMTLEGGEDNPGVMVQSIAIEGQPKGIKYHPIFSVTHASVSIGKSYDGLVNLYRPYITYEVDNEVYLAKYQGYYTKTLLSGKKYYFPVYKTIEKNGYLDKYAYHKIYEYGNERSAFEENHLPFVANDETVSQLSLLGQYDESEKGIINAKGTPTPAMEWKELIRSFVYAPDNVSSMDEPTLLQDPETEDIDEVEEETPVVEQRKYTPENLTKANMPENGIFVFGSNTLGKHGLGAASLAAQEFGAKYGQAKGPQGKSYAIVTKDLSKGKRSIPLEDIAEQLTDLFDYADQHPELTFYVTKIGTSLAGYSIEEMRSTFEGQDIPDNVILPKEFEVRDKEEIKEQEESPFYSDEELKSKGMKVGDYTGVITTSEKLQEIMEKYKHCE